MAEPDPASTKISVEVSEIECVSGRDPRPFLQKPKLVEDDQAVTVFWTSEMTLDAATCPGNPWVKQTLQLTEPLGVGSCWMGPAGLQLRSQSETDRRDRLMRMSAVSHGGCSGRTLR